MRNRIIESAIRQIQNYGVKRFTMQDIASDLGISKKTIYVHFDSKEDIISAIVDRLIAEDRMSHLEAMDIEGGFVAKIDALVNCYTHNRFPAQVYTDMQRFYPRQWDKLTEVKKFNQDLLSALITEAAGNGEIRPGITPEILEILVEKIIEIVVDNNYLIPQHLTLQQAFHELRNIILYGILNNNQSGEEDVREK